MKTLFAAGVAAVLCIAAGCGSQENAIDAQSSNIVNGQEDASGLYPQVGTVVARWSGPGTPFESFCSGTLIAHDVFLTAAHCVAELAEAGLGHEDFGVSFDAKFVPETSSVHFGTAYAHPDFSFETYYSDVGIIVFDAPVLQVQPARLARLNVLEELRDDKLADKVLVTVGYGSVNYPALDGRGTRRVALQKFLGLVGPDWGVPYYNWAVLGGPFEEGYGTTCLGDSGGPHLLDGKIVSITSFVDCDEGLPIEWSQRVDIPQVRAFIDQFVKEEDGD